MEEDSQDHIWLFKMLMGMRKYFFEIQFSHAPSNSFASPALEVSHDMPLS
jgi:hypothetical protein